jgi:hypothetical protein
VYDEFSALTRLARDGQARTGGFYAFAHHAQAIVASRDRTFKVEAQAIISNMQFSGGTLVH